MAGTGVTPKRRTESEPIAEVTKVVDPIKIEDTGGVQISPATEATLASVKTAVEIIDNFISGARGLVTEDNSSAIKTAVEAIDNFISGARGLVTEDNSAAIKTAVELIDNFISGARGLVTEDNSAAILAQLDITVSALRDAIRGASTKDLTTLETELAKKLNKATTPTKYALTITNANTEYSQALPANTKQFSVHLRDMTAFRLAYVTGKVATPTDPYETIPAGSEKYIDGIDPASLTLFIAAPAGTKTAEIEAWA